MKFGIKKLFTKKRIFFIRLDKNYKGSEENTFLPRIDFVKNELTGSYNPQIEIFDSIFRATFQLEIDGNRHEEKKVDIAQINGEELKAFIEKLNATYKKNFRIKYHLRNKETFWSKGFLSDLPEVFKIIRQDYFCIHGGVNIIQILIMIGIWILIVWMDGQVPY